MRGVVGILRGLCGRHGRRGAILMLAVLISACTSSPTGADAYHIGQLRVVELANTTLSLLPSDSDFVPHRVLTLNDADRELCHKKFAGFAYARLDAQQPEVTAFAELPQGANAKAVIAAIETAWRDRHYDVDTRGLFDEGFPQLHAVVGQYRLVVTSFSQTGGFANKPRISVYAVGQCLNP
jgi:hypothetical protein